MINRIETELGFKEQLLTLLPRKISQTTRFDDALEDLPTRHNYSSTERHTKISAEVIEDRFGIVFKRENANLKETLQRGTRLSMLLIIRRYIEDRQYGFKTLKRKYYTDTLWGESKYLRSNVATQVYSHKCGFTTIYHMKKTNNENIGHSLGIFISKYGVL